MSITTLEKAINRLSETQKTQFFEQITFSELSYRMLEKNVQNKEQFSQQFFQALNEEVREQCQKDKNLLAI